MEREVTSTLDIDLADIFYRMNQYLQEAGYFLATTEEEQNRILSDALKKYLLEKMGEYSSDLVDTFSILEIVEYIEVHRNRKSINYDQLIHYLLHLLSVKYNYAVIWEINEDEKDDECYIEYLDGCPNKLITSKNVDYYKAFGTLYTCLQTKKKELARRN